MNYENACKILGIDNSIDITIEVLKRQYKLRALQYHPDKNSSSDASERFQEINNSYQYLLRHLEFIESDDDESGGDDTSEDSNGYRSVLYRFLKNIFISTNVTGENNIFYKIIEKISTTCEEKALDTLEKIDKAVLIKIHETLTRYKDAFHFSANFFNKVEEIIKGKLEGDECIILHPTLEDLYDNNLYRLKVDNKTYIIPLWHHELVYDNSSCDLYVRCNPILAENISIDEDNNVHVFAKYSVIDIFDKDSIVIDLGTHKFSISVSTLFLKHKQTVMLKGRGIPRICSHDIYNVSYKGDIHIHIELYS